MYTVSVEISVAQEILVDRRELQSSRMFRVDRRPALVLPKWFNRDVVPIMFDDKYLLFKHDFKH